MQKLFSILIPCLLITGILQAQIDFCGTVQHREAHHDAWRAHYNQKLQSELVTEHDTMYVLTKIHSVGNSNGSGFYKLPLILESFGKLREDMAQANIQIVMDVDINFIANSSYNEHNSVDGRTMMGRNNVRNVINSYIVSDPNGACGYFSPTGDAVALQKGCLGANSTTWSHEFGHFLTLRHPFFGWEGTTYEYGDIAPRRLPNGSTVEMVARTNCQTAADGFCDTEADYLSDRWNCSNGSSPDTLYDADSVAFLVDGGNIMSYSNDGCAYYFSEEQIDAMHFDLNNRRTRFQYNGEIPQPITFEPTDLEVIQGTDNEIIDIEDITIRWRAVENATAYILQVRPRRPFENAWEYHVALDTFFTFEDLNQSTYEWAVTPYNGMYVGAPESIVHEFQPGELSSTDFQVSNSELDVFPSPVSSHEDLFVTYYNKNQSEQIQISLLNMNGQEVIQRNLNVQGQINNVQIQTSELSQGLYILKVRDREGIITKKLIVQ